MRYNKADAKIKKSKGGRHSTYDERLSSDLVVYAVVDCSTVTHDSTAELFQNFDAGNVIDIFGTALPPSKLTDSTSNSSLLHGKQVPDLCMDAKNDSVRFVTLRDRRCHTLHFRILAEAAASFCIQRVSMLDFDFASAASRTAVERNKEELRPTKLWTFVF